MTSSCWESFGRGIAFVFVYTVVGYIKDVFVGLDVQHLSSCKRILSRLIGGVGEIRKEGIRRPL